MEFFADRKFDTVKDFGDAAQQLLNTPQAENEHDHYELIGKMRRTLNIQLQLLHSMVKGGLTVETPYAAIEPVLTLEAEAEIRNIDLSNKL